MTSSLDQLVNEYEAAARRLTELHRRWGWIVLLGPRQPGRERRRSHATSSTSRRRCGRHWTTTSRSGTPTWSRLASRSRLQRGVDVIKVMASGGMTTVGPDPLGVQFDSADLWTVDGAAHVVGLPVLAHTRSLAGIRHALAAGVDGIEHFTGLTETGIRVPDEVLEAVAEAGVFVNPPPGFRREALASMPSPPHGIAAAMKRIALDLEIWALPSRGVRSRRRSSDRFVAARSEGNGGASGGSISSSPFATRQSSERLP